MIRLMTALAVVLAGAVPAVATEAVSGKAVNITGRLTVECTGAKLIRLRSEWSTSGDAVTEIDNGSGLIMSGGRAVSDRTMDVPLEPGVPYTVKLRVESAAGKAGTLTSVNTFWYSNGADCAGERTTASFVEFKPE